MFIMKMETKMLFYYFLGPSFSSSTPLFALGWAEASDHGSAEIGTTVCALPSVATKYGNSLGISVNENNFSTKLRMLLMHSGGQALERPERNAVSHQPAANRWGWRAAAQRHCIAVMIIM